MGFAMDSGITQTKKLDQLRKKAVLMRMRKKTLDEIQLETGLSHPTIISAYKKFLDGGWAAVSLKSSGRPTGVKGLGQNIASIEETLGNLMKITSPRDVLDTDSAFWNTAHVREWLNAYLNEDISIKSVQRYLQEFGLISSSRLKISRDTILKHTHFSKPVIFISGLRDIKIAGRTIYQLYLTDLRNSSHWVHFESRPNVADLLSFWELIWQSSSKSIALVSRYPFLTRDPDYCQWRESCGHKIQVIPYEQFAHSADAGSSTPSALGKQSQDNLRETAPSGESMSLTHLQRLEAESIQIMREVVAGTENPVMLYSIGKDSAVMLHIAMKAFYPSLPPFPLLHVDTTWKFQEMYEFRDKMVKDLGLELLTYTNPEGLEKGINPFTHGSAIHTDIMKTEALKQALDKYGFDAAFGGARRDEEKSRAKERIFSFRTSDHRWDPKSQRPELWKQYNARKHKGESIRVFPLSNWTELDIWQYIYLEDIPIVPLYYSAERPVVERDGVLIMVDDERMPLQEGELPILKHVRFRTLGCYPLTGAVESSAKTLPDIIQEMLLTNTSERQGRVIDHDAAASMEKKKQEGYF